jgi:iron complex outermembrane receptor protein
LALLGVGLSLFAANAAFAQATAPAAPGDETLKLEKFEVTGSYLPLSATVNASPVVQIESGTIGASGATDALRLLRQVTPLFAGNGNVGTELNNGGGGESYVALRNLTTLVLINGRRIVGSAGSSGTGTDLNVIPTSMIERIDIVKDSASTIYGTDAIGGVVNIILKKNYNGFETGVRYGTTGNHDYETRSFYFMGGVSTDKGSITVGAEHFENTDLLTTDRSITTLVPSQINALGFNVISAAFSGSYAGRIGSNVLAGSTWIMAGDPRFNKNILSLGMKSSPTDAPKTVNDLLAANILIPVASTPIGIAAGGATALNTTLFGNPIILPTKRNSAVVNMDRELMGKNLRVFTDFMFSQTTNGGSGLAPSPIAGVGPGGGNTLFIPANNPYNVFSVDFPGSIAARTRLEELGKRFSKNETNTWRLVGGFKGEINENYSWEASYGYSRSSLQSRVFGGANGANMNKAMIPLLSATGGYVFDSKGRPLSTLTDSSGNNLPVYNFFALPGFNAPETLEAIKTTLFQGSDSVLKEYGAILRGTPYELPAGPLSFAVGADYSKEVVTNAVDALYANGLALGYNAAQSFSGGSRTSKGAFGEFGVPLFSKKQNIPGAYALDLNLGYRYQKIQPGGNAANPKIGITWKPVNDDLVFRATWAKGFIAPAIISLFGPGGQNSPTFAVLEGNGSTSSGGSTGKVINIQGSSVELSNPYLLASRSTSFTAGVVYSPKSVKGFSASLDYYHIKQDKVGGLDYTTVVKDLNAKGSGSIYAQVYRGLPTGFVFADGSKLTSTAPNQITSTNFGTLTIANDPTGDQWTDGLDVSVNYDFTTADYGRFNVGAQANILFNYKYRGTPNDPYLQYARNFTDGVNGLGGANGLLPSYMIRPYINHKWKDLKTSVFMNYVPATNASGTLFGGASTTNGWTRNGLAQTIPSYFTVDLSFTYTIPTWGIEALRNTTITAGANNLLNKQPPYVAAGGNGSGENNTVKSTYDIIGRYMFFELKKSF